MLGLNGLAEIAKASISFPRLGEAFFIAFCERHLGIDVYQFAHLFSDSFIEIVKKLPVFCEKGTQVILVIQKERRVAVS